MRTIIALFVSALLSSCGTVYRVHDSVVDRSGATGPDRLLQVNLDDYRFPDQRPSGNTAYQQAVADESGVARDRLQMAIMTAADKNCAVHKSQALATFNNINLIPGLLGAGLSGAAAVAKGEIAKRLAAAAGFAMAARTEANTDIYRQSLIEAIFKALDNERQRLEQLIRTHRGQSTGKYPVDEAIWDAFRYAEACSIFQGVELLNQAVSNTNPCKLLRDRMKSLEGELAQEIPDETVKAAKQAEYNRLVIQASACSGTE